jgi:predicted metal-binding protein
LQPAFDELMKLTNTQGKQLFKIEVLPGKNGGDIIHFTRLAANDPPQASHITNTTSEQLNETFQIPEVPF